MQRFCNVIIYPFLQRCFETLLERCLNDAPLPICYQTLQQRCETLLQRYVVLHMTPPSNVCATLLLG